MSNECTAGDGGYQEAKTRHEWDGLCCILRGPDEHLEEFVVHLLLTWQIYTEGLPRKQAVETLPVIDMRLSVQKHPVLRSEEFRCDVHDAWFDEGRGIEDFARHITGRGNDDESASLCKPLASNSALGEFTYGRQIHSSTARSSTSHGIS